MKTETRKLADLKEYPDNARINADTVTALKGLMDKFGYLVPMVVTEEGFIVAGHARLKALKKQKVKEATVVVIKGDEKADEFRVLDNKIHEISDWDNEKLNIELRGLEETRLAMFPGLADPEQKPDTQNVTKDSVAKAQKKLDGTYEGAAKNQMGALVRVKCGGCGKEFQVKRWELKAND